MVGVFYFSRIYLWFVLYKLGLVKNPRIVLEYAIRFLRGKRVLGIQKLIKEFAVHELPPLFFRGMLEIIEGHKRAGRKIVLVSNTIDALVKEIASMIGVDDFIALKLEIKDNVYTGKVSGSLVYGENKYNVILYYLYTHKDISLSNSWAYADHTTDEKLLSAVEHPYAINPDSGLEKKAAAKKWPILKFNLLQ